MLLVQIAISGFFIYGGQYLAAFVAFTFLHQLNATIELRDEINFLRRNMR